MAGQEWGGNSGEYKARKDGDGKDVSPDALAIGVVRGTEDDALNLVVQTAACLEGV